MTLERKIDPTGNFARNFAKTMTALAAIVGEVNVRNGWDTSRRMIADPDAFDPEWVSTHKIAELGLIDTEVAEAIEEVRGNHPMNENRYPRQAYLASMPDNERDSYPEWPHGPYKPEGVPSELADVIIRVLDLADAYGIDIGAAVVEKINYNATRSLRHGGKAL